MFDRLIQVLKFAWHAIKMGLLVSFVALGAVVLWLFANRPDMDWAEALVADLRAAPVPVRTHAPQDWSVLCATPPGIDPVAALRDAGGGPHSVCDGWKPWYRYYPGIAALGFSGTSGCRAHPVPDHILKPAPANEAVCEARFGFMTLQLESGRLAVAQR